MRKKCGRDAKDVTKHCKEVRNKCGKNTEKRPCTCFCTCFKKVKVCIDITHFVVMTAQNIYYYL